MANNGKGLKGAAIIRIILCVIVLGVLCLGMFGIVTKKITVPVSGIGLLFISLWNGIDYFSAGRKLQSILIFLSSAVILAMVVLYFVNI